MLHAGDKQYKPHHRNIKVLGSDGTFIETPAWWSDDPVRDAINAANFAVKCYWEQYGFRQVRIVVDGNDNDKVLHTAMIRD